MNNPQPSSRRIAVVTGGAGGIGGGVVAALASGDLPFTTGAALQVDGGMHIHQY